MPVSTGSSVANGDRAAKRCKHCEESSHRVDSSNLFWKIQLDQDLLDTLVAIYPEWFKDYNLTRSPAMAEGGSGGSASSTPDTGPSSPRSHSTQGLLPLSPPKVEVDDSPLQKSMDKNKESLKVKLMMRRPIKMLVDQGIMPPLKTPPAFHEQRQKLERAKMGDLLKAKIQQRPNRQDLVNQHILEDAHVDPSIAEKQRMLKKARLADSLNDQLSHRPGPLELIQKNILHTEEPIERAVKDGVIPFKPTYEGQLTKPQHPNRYITYDEDSLSSEGGQSPLQTQPSTGLPEVRPQADVLEAAAASAGIVTVALTIPTTGGAVVVTSSSPAFRQAVSPVSDQQTATMTFADLCNSVVSPAGSLPTILPSPSPMSLGSTTSSLSPLSSVSSPPTPSPALARRTDAPGKDKNRKKSKSKSQPKTRTIKFHEYKGPPNAHKNLSVNSLPVETPYEILLQQQKLFLQWQLEWQHKYPQIILPASQKPLQVTTGSDMGSPASLSGLITATSPPPQQAVSAVSRPMSVMSPSLVTTQTPASLQEQNQPTQTLTQSLQPQTQPNALRIFGKLEDMKVSDLKAELKRRSLTVSGSKPQLIERLKPFTDTASSTQQTSSDSPQSTTSQTSVSTATSTTIPVSHMGHIVVEAPGSVMSEESLSSFSMDTPVSPNNQQMSLMVEGSVTDDEVSLPNFSPVSQQLSPPPSHQTMSPERDVDMDLSSPQPPPSPRGGEDIIRDQQRKIEELQRELLRSQLQLQQIRSGGKEVVNVVKQPSSPAPQQRAKTGPVVATTTTLPNGVVIDTTLAAKQNQKLVLQQHLQNKIQQQQLQMQLQQLQSLQQQQQQQQLQLQQQRQQQHVAFQQQQQQQGLSAKANLAAFLQNQTQQQQLTNLLQQQVANNNNNNNNNNNKLSTNNKKNSQSIVLGRQQTAIVLNQLKLHRQKAGTVNGVSTHQRTASLPNFLGSFVTQQQLLQQQRQEHPQQPQQQQQQRQEHPQQPQQIAELHNTSEAPQFLLTKPPPQYEEATKLLKVKQETTSMSISKSSSKQKNVKSQIVDDVLEILIKNGELPPSAAQDPATPTTPGRSLPQGLIFTASSPAPASPPVPPPPPPPPLPHSSFAITLPTAIRLASQTDNSVQPFQMQVTGPEALDLILNSVQPTDGTSEGHQLSSDLQTAAGIDLKELGLDLETLDSMDFGQLDCGDLGVSVKLEPSDLLDVVTDMEVGVETSIKQDDELTLPDQLMNQQELMDIGEMPMDMDDADWLESLMPSDSSAGTSGVEIGSVTTPPHHSSFVLPSTGGINLIQCHTDLDTYDPLLSNSQDPFDLFNIEDSEFKMVGDLTSSLGWDKVDFAT